MKKNFYKTYDEFERQAKRHLKHQIKQTRDAEKYGYDFDESDYEYADEESDYKWQQT